MAASWGGAAMGRDYEAELRRETEKWGARLEEALGATRPRRPGAEAYVANVRAYQRDAKHFQSVGDLVRSFESVVWAWAWLEIGRDQGLLEVPHLDEKAGRD